ncbi:MAG: PIN domain-containing protein, partial [Solirubrobacterales bacterium]|nr:PIN domain-containing protein [Solirubrobacterales bacterium]
MSARGVVLDAGAFIAIGRGDARMVVLARRFAQDGTPLVTSAGVVAQVWRGGVRRQMPLAYLLAQTDVVDPTARVGRTLGLMLATAGRSDPIDAHVVFLARERGWSVITSGEQGRPAGKGPARFTCEIGPRPPRTHGGRIYSIVDVPMPSKLGRRTNAPSPTGCCTGAAGAGGPGPGLSFASRHRAGGTISSELAATPG